jgi:hypothetical protein
VADWVAVPPPALEEMEALPVADNEYWPSAIRAMLMFVPGDLLSAKSVPFPLTPTSITNSGPACPFGPRSLRSRRHGA